MQLQQHHRERQSERQSTDSEANHATCLLSACHLPTPAPIPACYIPATCLSPAWSLHAFCLLTSLEAQICRDALVEVEEGKGIASKEALDVSGCLAKPVALGSPGIISPRRRLRTTLLFCPRRTCSSRKKVRLCIPH